MEKPSSFITVKEAIELIDTDTRTNPTVDVVKLVRGIEYLRTSYRGGGMNYTIHLVKRDDTGKIVSNGKKFAQVTSAREQNELEYAIMDHYRKNSGKDLNPDELGLYKQETVVNKKDSSADGRPRINTSSKLKPGDELGTSEATKTVEEY